MSNFPETYTSCARPSLISSTLKAKAEEEFSVIFHSFQVFNFLKLLHGEYLLLTDGAFT